MYYSTRTLGKRSPTVDERYLDVTPAPTCTSTSTDTRQQNTVLNVPSANGHVHRGSDCQLRWNDIPLLLSSPRCEVTSPDINASMAQANQHDFRCHWIHRHASPSRIRRLHPGLERSRVVWTTSHKPWLRWTNSLPPVIARFFRGFGRGFWIFGFELWADVI